MIDITHTQARMRLRQALNRRLPDEQWDALQAHLEHCADCRDYQKRLAGVEKNMRRVLHARWETVPNKPVDVSRLGKPDLLILDRQILDRLPAPLTSLLLPRQKEDPAPASRSSPLGWGGLLLLFLLIFTLLQPDLPRTPAEVIVPPPALATPAPTNNPTPTPLPDTFRGAALFQTGHDGSAEIYLINAGGPEVELSNLTQDPADDTFPIWSPDGEWIAFLSERTGKPELFTLHVSGARLTQITQDPHLHWQGPLSWSADGKQIALIGMRKRPGEFMAPPGQVYLVPLDGSTPYSLGGTLGASFPRFAPRFSSALAFTGQRDGRAAVSVFDINGERDYLAAQYNNAHNMATGEGGAFRWSSDGQSLLYLAHGPLDPQTNRPIQTAGHELRVTLAPYHSYYSDVNPVVFETTGPVRPLQAVWTPDGRSILFSLAREKMPCVSLNLRPSYDQRAGLRSLPGPCIAGQMEEASWSRDGRWLLLSGFAADPSEKNTPRPAIYALHNPSRGGQSFPGGREVFFQTLLEDIPVSGALQVRPDMADERLDAPLPNPVPDPVGQELPGPLPPAELLDRAVFVHSGEGLAAWTGTEDHVGEQDGSKDAVARLLGQGSGWNVLTGPVGARCLGLSPDGSRLAFLAPAELNWDDRSEPFTNRETQAAKDPKWEAVPQVFVQDIGQQGRLVFPQQASSMGQIAARFPEEWVDMEPRFGCPVWSPGGERLAVVMNTGRGGYLAVLTPDEAGDGRAQEGRAQIEWIRAGPVTSVVDPSPRWTADGTAVVLAYKNGGTLGDQPIQIAAIRPGAVPGQKYRPLVELNRAGRSPGLAISPDGNWMAYLELSQDVDFQVHSRLRLTGADGLPRLQWIDLPVYSALSSADGYGGLHWWAADEDITLLPGGWLGFYFKGSPTGRVKAELYAYHPQTRKLHTLAHLEDVLFDAAFSKDGKWVLFSTESGLYTLDVQGALAGTASPVRMNGEIAKEVEW